MKVDDVRTILSALNDANVRYLIVGGLAVVAHGYVRFTQDIDLVVQLERENVLRAMSALMAIGYRPLIPVEAAQFADETLRQQWRDENGMIVSHCSIRTVKARVLISLLVNRLYLRKNSKRPIGTHGENCEHLSFELRR
jgi:hypothetical protein